MKGMLPVPPRICTARVFHFNQSHSSQLRRHFGSSLHRPSFSTTTTTMTQEYKLKLGSLELKDLEKQEVEVEGIEGGKVLLVKLGEDVHALSPKCTHYGAPLVNGVMTPDGRLTCPWHGGTHVK